MTFRVPQEFIHPDLVDLLARRPELRDVGIAGYLAGAAVDGAPGKPKGPVEMDFLWNWAVAA